jgi:hypothetical protein
VDRLGIWAVGMKEREGCICGPWVVRKGEREGWLDGPWVGGNKDGGQDFYLFFSLSFVQVPFDSGFQLFYYF